MTKKISNNQDNMKITKKDLVEYYNRINRRDFLKTAMCTGLAFVGASLPFLSSCDTVPEPEPKPYRFIDIQRCVGCGRCVPLCPMGAIQLINGVSRIDPDECAECGVCMRSMVCSAEAIYEGELVYPRTLRDVFSNPLSAHEITGVRGRGTEGIKTNDISNRYQEGYFGVFVELGRPVLGTRFEDAGIVLKKFSSYGYTIVEDNPVYSLMSDPLNGDLDAQILNEKVISCLTEFIMPADRASDLKSIINELNSEVNSVFNVSVAVRGDESGNSLFNSIFGNNMPCIPWTKVNIGINLI